MEVEGGLICIIHIVSAFISNEGGEGLTCIICSVSHSTLDGGGWAHLHQLKCVLGQMGEGLIYISHNVPWAFDGAEAHLHQSQCLP